MSPIALECRQELKKIYFSSKVLVRPDQWDGRQIVNHGNAEKLMVYLIHWRNSIEEIELDALLKGRHLTLYQLKTAVSTGLRSNATLKEFSEKVIENDSSRCKTTKRSYLYLVRELEKEHGMLTLDDITYDFIIQYRERLRKKGISENTIKGRLKSLRCLLEQAKLRDLIDRNPFERITIGNIGGRIGGLTMDEVKSLEELHLTGMEEKVRDLFCLGVYTGLRIGDLTTLEEAEIKDGILRKMMHKTHHEVVLPIGLLFHGKPLEIINKYHNIKDLSHCCCNSQANRILKELAKKAGIKKRCYFHLARKTFGQLLNSCGMDMTDISILMGHRDLRTTRTHYVFNDVDRMKNSVERIFENADSQP